ncbi:YcjX family protein [Reyranella sp.]|uniref:YcjX family protein n=1 Tax=Reyranella sp. TaxID=1929291 RepID=UPI003BAC5837
MSLDPLSRLGDLAAGSLDAIASALATASPLGQGSHRIAVTGLQRAGKTVFVTSFVHALLHAKDAPVEAFPFFPWRERLRTVELLSIPGLPPFPYRERLADLLADPPRWPEPTEGLSGVRVRLRLSPPARLDRRLFSPQTLHIDLVDYPGEWLLDLPMLSLDYDEWSLQMEEMAASGRRAALSEAWRAEAAKLDPAAAADDFALARVGGAYVEYLKRCRAAGLHFLQPGRFMAGGAPLGSLFFPLSRARGARSGTAGAALARRYEAYRRVVRRFYAQVFGRLRRQVVLVDLLTALQQGQESFADLALATRTVVEAFESLKHPLARLLPVGRLDRLSLVATKADHITSGQHNNLVGLLRDMLGEPFVRANARQAGLLAVASVRATSQVTRLWRDEPLQFLRGVPSGRSEVVEVRPGEIPGQIPGRDDWSGFVFNIRGFEPPRLEAPFERPLPHINLDKVLQSLIA